MCEAKMEHSAAIFDAYPEPSTHVYPVATLKAYDPRIHPSKAIYISQLPGSPVIKGILMLIKCYESFWDMLKAGAVRLSLIFTHICLEATYNGQGYRL
jgi:hypothetical protein